MKNGNFQTQAALYSLVVFVLMLGALCTRRAMFFADFPAFYCGGALTLQHTNPYFLKPILACEKTIQIHNLLTEHAHALPLSIPYPAYALYFFSLFALVPVPVALVLWILLGCIATGFVAAILQRELRLSRSALLLIVAFPAVNTVIALGHPTMLLAAALCAAVTALRSGRDLLACIVLLPALLYPQCGITAYLGLAIARSNLRKPIALMMLIFVAIALALGGVRDSFFYVTTVLREHALIGTVHSWQYGMITIFYLLNGHLETALFFGKCSLVAGMLCAFACARRVSLRTSDDAGWIVLPPTFALLCYYANGEHVVALVPALLLLNRRTSNAGLGAASIAAWCPWAATGSVVALIGLPLTAYSTFRASSVKMAALFAMIFVGLASLYIHGLSVTTWHMQAPQAIFLPQLVDGTEFIRVLGEDFVVSTVLWTVLKIPTWFGLLWLMKNCYGDSENEVGVERSVPN